MINDSEIRQSFYKAVYGDRTGLALNTPVRTQALKDATLLIRHLEGILVEYEATTQSLIDRAREDADFLRLAQDAGTHVYFPMTVAECRDLESVREMAHKHFIRAISPASRPD